MKKILMSSVLATSVAVGLGARASDSNVPGLPQLKTMTARFAPVDIGADLSGLPANERQALARMIEAAKVFDPIFLRQVWSGNETVLLDLAEDQSELGRARLHYFLINKGPWSRLDHFEPFVPGVPKKAEQANFYPAGATKAEVEAWMKTLPDAERERAMGFFTTIRRDPAGTLVAIPYSTEYQGELAHAAALLREAASLTKQPTLKAFLEKRAEAFITNDYYASDVAWMELDASIEPTIGPYETYEDEWFGFKASFEAFITLRDDAETNKLTRFASELQDIENNLPIDPKYRNPRLGALAPIRVVNTVFSSGDGNRGVQTAAYNLPNDERVIKEKGSKRVMLKNNQEAKFKVVLVPISKVALPAKDQGNVRFDVFFTHILMHELMHGLGPHNITVGGRGTTVRQEFKDTYAAMEEAKFKTVLLPIARVALTAADQKRVSFDAFFTHILMHELMHGLGPHNITVGGRASTVRQELKETYSAIEEAKADVSGLWALARLAGQNHTDAAIAKTMYTTFLASAFRSIRFGINEAHGRGIAIQLNYLLDKGGFRVNTDGTFTVNEAAIGEAVTSLTREIMTLQAEGSYAKAKALIEELGVVRPQVQKVLDRLMTVPVDIEPRFTSAAGLK